MLFAALATGVTSATLGAFIQGAVASVTVYSIVKTEKKKTPKKKF